MGVPCPIEDRQFYEGVALRRAIAFAIDLCVIAVLFTGVALVGALIGLLTFGAGFAILAPALALVGFAYRFTLLRERSATLGMLAVGIELRDGRGERLDGPAAAAHVLGFYASLYLPFLMVASWLFMAVSARRQLLHDLPLGAVMINRPA